MVRTIQTAIYTQHDFASPVKCVTMLMILLMLVLASELLSMLSSCAFYSV